MTPEECLHLAAALASVNSDLIKGVLETGDDAEKFINDLRNFGKFAARCYELGGSRVC